MERIFFTMETFSGVSSLILALFLHFSEVPKGEMCRRNKHSRIYVEAAYILVGLASLGIAFSTESYHETLKAFFIQSLAPIQTLLFLWSITYPIYIGHKLEGFMWRQLIYTFLLAAANLIYYFGLDGQTGTLLYYVLMACYALLLILYIRVYLRISRRWTQVHPERAPYLQKRIHPLCIGLCIMFGLSVVVNIYPYFISQLIFTGIYTIFYIVFALQFHNYGIYIANYPLIEENETPDQTPASPTITLTIDNTTVMKKNNELNYEKIEEKIKEWTSGKGYLHSGLTIQEMSKEIGINRTYLSNFINDTYQTNFNGWVNGLRIEEAKERMINNPDISLAEVAEQVGFADLAHFSKQFKAKEGQSPSTWRKEIRKAVV